MKYYKYRNQKNYVQKCTQGSFLMQTKQVLPVVQYSICKKKTIKNFKGIIFFYNNLKTSREH